MSIESMMLSNHLILCCPLLLLPPIFPNIRVFSSELTLCLRWPKYWSFSFSISPSSEYSGLISFRIDWFDLLAVQGSLKSSLAPQFESISSSALSLSYGPTLTPIPDYWKNHPYTTTGRMLGRPKKQCNPGNREKETQRTEILERKQPHHRLCQPRECTELFSSLVLPHIKGTWPHFLVSWGI